MNPLHNSWKADQVEAELEKEHRLSFEAFVRACMRFQTCKQPAEFTNSRNWFQSGDAPTLEDIMLDLSDRGDNFAKMVDVLLMAAQGKPVQDAAVDLVRSLADKFADMETGH